MCYQGDLKRYLRAQRKSDGMTPDLLTREMLTLQRMAFEITSGLLHLHENNYIHRSVRSYPGSQAPVIDWLVIEWLIVNGLWLFCLQWSGFEELSPYLWPHCQNRRLWAVSQPLQGMCVCVCGRVRLPMYFTWTTTICRQVIPLYTMALLNNSFWLACRAF